MHKNIFEKYPKITGVTLIFIVLILFILIIEKIFDEPKITVLNKGEQRFIRLREHGPHFYAKMIPDANYLKTTDSLTQKEYLLRTDDKGYIIPSRIHEKPDLTIAFLGGSTTECSFVDENLRFPFLVGRLLEDKLNRKVNSYNAGMSGNNTMHSIDILLNKVLQIEPDVVVMMENINDLVMLLIEKSYFSDNPSRSLIVEDKMTAAKLVSPVLNGILPNVKQYLLTRLNVQADEFDARRGKLIQVNKNALLEQFKMNLQTFIEICKIRKIIPVLMTQENRLTQHPDPVIQSATNNLLIDYGLSYQEFKMLIDAFNQATREVAIKNKVLLIDLAEVMPQSKAYMYDIVHMNTQGSQFAANIISSALLPLAGHLR